MSKFFSRKFILALIFALSACAALFVSDKIDGGQFVALAGIILGAFTAGDVALNYIHTRKTAPKKVEPYLLSDHLAEALYRLNLAREAIRDNPVRHREAAMHAIAEAEKAIAHVLGLISERVE